MTSTQTRRSPANSAIALAVVLAMTAGAAILFFFDPANSGFYPICLFHRMTGLLCPACGSLRALHQLLHGNIAAAFHFNPVLVVSLPLAILFATRSMDRQSSGSPRFLFVSAKWIWLFLALVVLVISIWRNVPGTPLALVPR